MKRTELARLLHGGDYAIPRDIRTRAARAGLVIVSGPDLVLSGAIEGQYNGIAREVYFDAEGILPDAEDVAEEDQRAYYDRKRLAVRIDIEQHDFGRHRWTYQTIIPHSTCDLYNEHTPYVKALVFALVDAGLSPAA